MASPGTLKSSLFLALATVGLLPIVLVSVLVLYDLAGDRADTIGEKNLLLAKAVGGQVEVFLREPQETLGGIAGLLLARPSMSRAEIEGMLDVIVGKSELLESIYVLDEEGLVLGVGLPEAQQSLRSDFLGTGLGHLAFFQDALRTGKRTWSDTFLSVSSGRMSMALALPVGGRVLVGHFNIGLLNDFVQKLLIGEHLIVSIVDGRGNIVAHPDPVIAGRQVNIGHLPPVRDGLSGGSGTYD